MPEDDGAGAGCVVAAARTPCGARGRPAAARAGSPWPRPARRWRRPSTPSWATRSSSDRRPLIGRRHRRGRPTSTAGRTGAHVDERRDRGDVQFDAAVSDGAMVFGTPRTARVRPDSCLWRFARREAAGTSTANGQLAVDFEAAAPDGNGSRCSRPRRHLGDSDDDGKVDVLLDQFPERRRQQPDHQFLWSPNTARRTSTSRVPRPISLTSSSAPTRPSRRTTTTAPRTSMGRGSRGTGRPAGARSATDRRCRLLRRHRGQRHRHPVHHPDNNASPRTTTRRQTTSTGRWGWAARSGAAAARPPVTYVGATPDLETRLLHDHRAGSRRHRQRRRHLRPRRRWGGTTPW